MARSPRVRTVAVASIGSGSVSLGLATLGETGASVTTSVVRTLSLEDREPEHAIAALKQQLLEAGKAFLGKQRPDALYCVVRAPWTKASVVQIETHFDKEGRVTGERLAELAEQARAASQVPPELFLEATLVHIALNGYSTERPVGKIAHRIATTVLVATCEPMLRTALSEALSQLFPQVPLHLYSGARALFEWAHAAHPEVEEYIVLDVTEGGTEALVVHDAAVASEGFSAEGMRSVLESASPSGKPEDARAALSLMAREQCSTPACAAVQEHFAKNEPDLARRFGDFFATLATPRRLPTMLFIAADASLSPLLERFFARIDFTQFTLTAQPFSTSSLSVRDLIPAGEEHPSQSDLALALSLINK